MSRLAAAAVILACSLCLTTGAAESKTAVVAVLVAPGVQSGTGGAGRKLPGKRADRAADCAATLEALVAEEPGFTPVERGKLDALLREQKLGFTGLADARTCARTGRLLQADFMVSVVLTREGVGFRIVETATAKVLAERERERPGDIFLAARMVFEELVRAVKRAPKLSNRLTVGIGAVYNESGTDRSDKLGEELAEGIRHHLRHESWAIVLERQYPEPLLVELGLARSGRAKAKAISVPQADVVIVASFVEETRQFARGLDYPVAFKITVASGRKGGPRYKFEVGGRSNGIDAVAAEVVKRARVHRRSLAVVRAVGLGQEDEIARLVRAAELLAPRLNTCKLSDGTIVGQVYAITERQYADARRALRALENVLLIDGGNDDARMLLGCCLIALHERALHAKPGTEKHENAYRQFRRGADLVYAALQKDISERNAAHCFWAIGPCVSHRIQPQADGLIETALANEGKFAKWQMRGIRDYRSRLHTDLIYEDFRRLVTDFENHEPREVWWCLEKMKRAYKDSPEKLIAFARREADGGRAYAENVYVRFCIERFLGQLLHEQEAPAAVDHFMKALSLRDEAIKRLRHSNREDTNSLDGAYGEAYRACVDLGRPEVARQVLEQAVTKTAWSKRTRECAILLARLYEEEGQLREALELCERVLRSVSPSDQLESRGDYLELRQRVKARLEGRTVPGFDALERLGGDGNWVNAQIVEACGKIWVLRKHRGGSGILHCIDPETGKLIRPRNTPGGGTSVAGAAGKLFVSTSGQGLYVIDGSGRKRKLLRREKGEIPSDYVELLTSTGEGPRDVIYMAFCHSYQKSTDRNAYGVARLDPRTLKVTLITSGRRDVSAKEAPVTFIRQLVWDPEEGALWTGGYNSQWFYYESFHWVDAFRWKDATWQRVGRKPWPDWKVVQDGRTLSVSRQGRTVTARLHSGEVLLSSRDPVLLSASSAAWDRKRLWLATYTGIQEIDRATGRMKCIAHKDETPVAALLRHGGWLYIGARDGIYRYRIP